MPGVKGKTGIYKRTKAMRIKNSLSKKGKKAYQWKGNFAGYIPKHTWFRKTFGKATKCENKDCKYPRVAKDHALLVKPKRFEWANISKKYLRIRSDYIQLCPSCHRKWDMGIIKLKLKS